MSQTVKKIVPAATAVSICASMSGIGQDFRIIKPLLIVHRQSIQNRGEPSDLATTVTAEPEPQRLGRCSIVLFFFWAMAKNGSSRSFLGQKRVGRIMKAANTQFGLT